MTEELEPYYDGNGMLRNQRCPTDDCDGIDTFYRWVADTVESDLEGNTGDFDQCGDSDAITEAYQGIWCSTCELRVDYGNDDPCLEHGEVWCTRGKHDA